MQLQRADKMAKEKMEIAKLDKLIQEARLNQIRAKENKCVGRRASGVGRGATGVGIGASGVGRVSLEPAANFL